MVQSASNRFNCLVLAEWLGKKKIPQCHIAETVPDTYDPSDK